MKPLFEHAAALGAYLVLSCLLTWPTVTDLAGHVYTSAGGRLAYPGHDDIALNVWSLWWFAEALERAANPFTSPLLYHPDGVQLYVQTFNPVAGLLTLPVQWIAGPVAAYNVGLLIAFALTGYAIFLWARMAGAARGAAWIGGALVTAAPFHMLKLDVNHYNLVHMQWLAFCAPALAYAERRGGWRAGLPLAAVLILTVLGDWYWALTAALFVGVWAALSLISAPERGRRFAAFATAAAVAGAALGPFLVAAYRAQTRLAPPGDPALITRSYSADLFGLLAPSLRQPFWTETAERLALPFVRDVALAEGWYLAAGWVLLALAAVGAQRHGRALWRPLAAAGVGWVLGLGPVLRVLGIETGVSLPFAWLAELPLFAVARRPNLFAASCLLVLGVLAALGVSRLVARAGRRGWIVFGVIGALAALELWPPVRYGVSMAAPAVYTEAFLRSGPLLDVPIGRDIEGRTLQNQIAHGQPIARGYIPRPPLAPELAYEPVLRGLAYGEPLPAQEIIALDVDALALRQCRYGWRHLVVEPALLTAAERTGTMATLAALGGTPEQPVYADATHSAYTLPPAPAACRPYTFLGAGWGRLEQADERRWRWLGAHAELWLVNPQDTPRAVVLELELEGYDPDNQGAVPLEVWLEGRRIGLIEVGRAARTYRIGALLPPGVAQLEWRSVPRSDPSGRMISVSVGQVALEP